MLLRLLLNVLDVIEVAELLLRIKGGSGRTSSADFSNLLSNSSTLESANSGTSAENKQGKKEKAVMQIITKHTELIRGIKS